MQQLNYIINNVTFSVTTVILHWSTYLYSVIVGSMLSTPTIATVNVSLTDVISFIVKSIDGSRMILARTVVDAHQREPEYTFRSCC